MGVGTFLAGENPLHDPIALFLVQTLIIVTLSRVLAVGLGYLRQPRVIAEVIGGILLGPSVLSRSAAFKDNVFPKVPYSIGICNVCRSHVLNQFLVY